MEDFPKQEESGLIESISSLLSTVLTVVFRWGRGLALVVSITFALYQLPKIVLAVAVGFLLLWIYLDPNRS